MWVRRDLWQASRRPLITLANVLSIDKDHCIASWDRVLIQIWRGPITPEAAQRLRDAGNGFLRGQEDASCSSLSIVESTSPPPTDKVRAALANCYSDFRPKMCHEIFVAEGSAIRSAFVRAMGLAMSMLGPVLIPFQFVSSVAEAASLVAPTLSSASGGPAQLNAIVVGLRIELDHQNGLD